MNYFRYKSEYQSSVMEEAVRTMELQSTLERRLHSELVLKAQHSLQMDQAGLKRSEVYFVTYCKTEMLSFLRDMLMKMHPQGSD